MGYNKGRSQGSRTRQQSIENILWLNHMIQMNHQRYNKQHNGRFRDLGENRVGQRQTEEAQSRKTCRDWDKRQLEAAALDRLQRRRSEVQCVHVDADWVTVKVKGVR